MPQSGFCDFLNEKNPGHVHDVAFVKVKTMQQQDQISFGVSDQQYSLSSDSAGKQSVAAGQR